MSLSSAFTLDSFTQHSACLLPQWMQHHSQLNMRPLIDAVTLLLYPVLVCCLWCLTRDIDGVTIPYNVWRGMLDAMIFSCGHYWVTQAICKGKHYQALVQISAISQGIIKTKRIIEICIICVTTMNTSNMDTQNVHCALTYHQEWLIPWHPPYPLEDIACDTACTTEWRMVIPTSSVEGSCTGRRGYFLLCSSRTAGSSRPSRRNGRTRSTCLMSTAQTLGGNFLFLRRYWEMQAR